MRLQSMTGFARQDGQTGRFQWAWELRSVNGKGLDVRLRLPTGFERIEADGRRLMSSAFSRGNIQASLSIQAAETRVEAVVNKAALDALLSLKAELGGILDPAPLKFDTLLAARGVIDFRDATDESAEVESLDKAVLNGLGKAIAGMLDMRNAEGGALKEVLLAQVSGIERLAALVEMDPSRNPDEIRQRLEAQVSQLMGLAGLDRDRLYAEVALLATKADLREEIDRLKAHVIAVRELLASGGPVGRKLDFLAQEFNRESNTICSKSVSAAVTAAGVELKVLIDQFREQVQNLE